MLKTMRPCFTAPKISAICNLLGSFSLFWGHFDVKNYASSLYSAKNIRNPLFVGIFFFTFWALMGATERPRYTGFRGLSVRAITALQCTFLRCTALQCLVSLQCLSKNTPPHFLMACQNMGLLQRHCQEIKIIKYAKGMGPREGLLPICNIEIRGSSKCEL